MIIDVQNTAEEGKYSGDIVFLGVGITVVPTRTHGQRTDSQNLKRSLSIKTTVNEKNERVREKYRRGAWISGDRFPEYTDDEARFGQILFPQESARYILEIARNNLSYYQIQVEGQLSRRHLFHIYKPVEELDAYARPVIIEALKKFSNVDLFSKLNDTVSTLPDISPESPLRILDLTKQITSRLQQMLGDEIVPQVYEAFRGMPYLDPLLTFRQSVNEFIKNVEIGSERILKEVENHDAGKIKAAVGELKAQLATWNEIEQQENSALNSLGINPREVS